MSVLTKRPYSHPPAQFEKQAKNRKVYTPTNEICAIYSKRAEMEGSSEKLPNEAVSEPPKPKQQSTPAEEAQNVGARVRQLQDSFSSIKGPLEAAVEKLNRLSREVFLNESELDSIRRVKADLLRLKRELELSTLNDPAVKMLKDEVDLFADSLSTRAIRKQLQPSCDIVAHVLGLERDFVHKIFEGTSGPWDEHETEEEAILRSLENMCECTQIGDINTQDEAQEALQKVGFTEARAENLAHNFEKSAIDHYGLFDLAIRYVEDLSEHDLILADHLPENRPHDAPIGQRFEMEAFVTFDQTKSVPASKWNLNNQNEEGLINFLKSVTTEGQSGQGDCKLWFHGTNSTNAEKILSVGIENKEGRAKKDFSHKDGFYVSDNFKLAKDWSSKDFQLRTATLSVLFVFSVPDSFFKQFEGIVYTDSDESSRKEWATVIRYYRSGQKYKITPELHRKLRTAAYIKGPINADSDVTIKVKKGRDTQLCLRKQEASDLFNGFLSAVIYFTREDTAPLTSVPEPCAPGESVTGRNSPRKQSVKFSTPKQRN